MVVIQFKCTYNFYPKLTVWYNAWKILSCSSKSIIVQHFTIQWNWKIHIHWKTNDTIPSCSEVFFFIVALIRINIIVIFSTQVVFIMRVHVKKTRFLRTTVRSAPCRVAFAPSPWTIMLALWCRYCSKYEDPVLRLAYATIKDDKLLNLQHSIDSKKDSICTNFKFIT